MELANSAASRTVSRQFREIAPTLPARPGMLRSRKYNPDERWK
jgi:hypothetical protein